jgi:hypothetical protein
MRLLRRETILRLTRIGTSGLKVGGGEGGRLGVLAGNTAAIRSRTLAGKKLPIRVNGSLGAFYVCDRVIGSAVSGSASFP